MLISVGKLSSIGEMFTIKLAASDPPGERQTSIFDSFEAWVQPDGTVQDIPCWSHFTVWPPANACICAAVGVACSASPPLSLDADLPGPLEFVDVFSLLLKLQSESANPRTSKTGICFMGHTHEKELEEKCASIPNRAWKSMIDGGLGPSAPCSPMNGGGVIRENHSIIFFIATRERCGRRPSRGRAQNIKQAVCATNF